MRIWYLDAGTLTAGQFKVLAEGNLPTVTDLGWQIVTAGDCNGDGAADLLWRRGTDGRHYVWNVDPAGAAGGVVGLLSFGALPPLANVDWKLEGVGDFNGDGRRCDVLWRNGVDGRNVIWHVDSTSARLAADGSFPLVSGGVLPTVAGAPWTIAAVGYFDGDKQSDILWRNTDGRAIVWYANGAQLGADGIVPLLARDGLVPASTPANAEVVRNDRVVSTAYTIGGTVSGLAGSGLVLQNNAGDSLVISGNGAFVFGSRVPFGGAYAVTVAAQPTGQTCSVANASGTFITGNVVGVAVTCNSGRYVISGQVSGLRAGGLVVLNNSVNSESIEVKGNGSFSFPTTVPYGGSYQIGVTRVQPNGQTCVVRFGLGTPVTAIATGLQVECFLAGSVMSKIGVNGSGASKVAVQPDGKVLVAGVSLDGIQDQDFALARYGADGRLDETFGTNGLVITNLSMRVASTDWLQDMLVQPDGKIVMVGYTQVTGSPARGLAVARYTPDGTLDTSFASNGVVTLYDTRGQADLLGHALALQADGKLVIGGSINCVSRFVAGYCTLIVKLTNSGELDTTFGNRGGAVAESETGGVLGVADLALDGAGNVLVVGSRDDGNGDVLAVARYISSGAPDASFGTSGRVTVAIGQTVGSKNYGKQIAVQPDGKIVVLGEANTRATNNHMSVTRLMANGSVDSGFGQSGSVVIYVAPPPDSDSGNALALQEDGKIIVAGDAYFPRTNTQPIPGFFQPANQDFAIVRLTAAGATSPLLE